MKRRPRIYLALASMPLLFSAAACSDADNDGDDSTFADDGNAPGETVKAALEDYLDVSGVVGTVASCEDIEDKVDATSTCTATIDDLEGEVPVTVAKTTDTTVFFDFDLTEWGYESAE